MALQITGQAQGIVQTTSQKSGAPSSISVGWHNELLASEMLPRYTYGTLTGNQYSISSAGAGQTQVAANLFSTAIATFQPIVGVYNPLTNNKNAVITKMWVGVVGQAASATVTGGFMLVVSSGQRITQAGTVPVNHLTLKQQGSTMIGLVNQALTGATGSLLVLRPVASTNPNTTNTAPTITPFSVYEEQTEGAIIVPPGGVIGIANGITGTTNTFQAGMSWIELPI